jgi:hypothetical protein
MKTSSTVPSDAAPAAKLTRVRRWNDQAYKEFVAVCAENLGISINALYKRAGVDPSSHCTEAKRNGRSIEQILAIADACQKDPMLFIAAGTISLPHKAGELGKLAIVSTLASHLYVALSPTHPSTDDIPNLVDAVLSAIKRRD